MSIEIGFTNELTNTQFAPLAILSAHYQEKQTLAALRGVQIPMKTRDFGPGDKLIQILWSIFAGCGPLYGVNSKLKPEKGMAAVWGWDHFSDQSTLSRVLDRLTQKQIEQLREAATLIWRTQSQAREHDWRGYLWLDFDLSGLPCSARAEESQKGYFSGKNHFWAPTGSHKRYKYRETIWSNLYPGNRHTVDCLQPAVLAAENALELGFQQRKRTVIRIDGGAGNDAHLRWLLSRNYHVMAKGMSNRRAEALSRQVQRWDTFQHVELGEVEPPTEDGRPVRVFVKRRFIDGRFRHSYYISTLRLPCKGRFIALYDRRGGAEVEQFRGDKSGLGIDIRRKHSFQAQKGFVLLADIAHNLLADFHQRALAGSRFDGYGPKRILRDLFATPGRLHFENGFLVRVDLLSQKQFSKDLAICLVKYCSDQ